MKTLEFTDAKQYDFIYEAVLGKQDGYDLQVGRVAGKILDKLEAIGKEKETVRGGVTLYTLGKGESSVELEDAEYDLVKRAFTTIVWMGQHVRDAVAVADWLDKQAQPQA